mmetsp:Transcript_16215/g.38432  ORF Transcript_16215/g.38432 Transcript_16215/m.38432 type:complete len:386 (+) Transcript_16215:50-1207(+)
MEFSRWSSSTALTSRFFIASTLQAKDSMAAASTPGRWSLRRARRMVSFRLSASSPWPERFLRAMQAVSFSSSVGSSRVSPVDSSLCPATLQLQSQSQTMPGVHSPTGRSVGSLNPAAVSRERALLSQKTRHMHDTIAAMQRLLPVPGGPWTSVTERPAAVFRTHIWDALRPRCASSLWMTFWNGSPAPARQAGGFIHETFRSAQTLALSRTSSSVSESPALSALMASWTRRAMPIASPLPAGPLVAAPCSTRQSTACIWRRNVVSSLPWMMLQDPFSVSTLASSVLFILVRTVMYRSPTATMGASRTFSKPSLASRYSTWAVLLPSWNPCLSAESRVAPCAKSAAPWFAGCSFCGEAREPLPRCTLPCLRACFCLVQQRAESVAM